MSARDLSDPILLELVKNGLDAIVDEMAIASRPFFTSSRRIGSLRSRALIACLRW